MMYVYILRCSDDSFYTGVTSDIAKRLVEHQEKAYSKCYTASRLPIKLEFHCTFTDPNQAIAFEKQVKRWSRKKKIAMIEGRWDDLPELAKRQTEFQGLNLPF